MNITPVTPKPIWNLKTPINGGKTLPKMPLEQAVEEAKQAVLSAPIEPKIGSYDHLIGQVQRPIWNLKTPINGGVSLPADVRQAAADERLKEAADKAFEAATRPRLGQQIELDPRAVARAKNAPAKEVKNTLLSFIKKHKGATAAVVVAIPLAIAAAIGIKKAVDAKKAEPVQK
jgi:hypothetical protein